MTKAITMIAAILTAAVPAASQDAEFARPGPYIGVGGSWGIYTELEGDLEDQFAVSANAPEPLGFNVRAGYRFHPWVAAEAEYEFLTDGDIELAGMEAGEIGTWAITVNAKLFPLHGRFQPYLLLGLGAVRQEVEDTLGLGIEDSGTAVAGRLGGGIDAYVTERVGLWFDITYLIQGVELEAGGGDYLSFGLGVQYRF